MLTTQQLRRRCLTELSGIGSDRAVVLLSSSSRRRSNFSTVLWLSRRTFLCCSSLQFRSSSRSCLGVIMKDHPLVGQANDERPGLGGTAGKALFRCSPRRFLSDNLLGHSPMAPKAASSSSNQKSAHIPTAEEVANAGKAALPGSAAAAGGVWTGTSAKREKLGELRLELSDGQTTLDDAATPQQKLDLDLADGLNVIAKAADTAAWPDCTPTTSVDTHTDINDYDKLFTSFQQWLDSTETTSAHQDALLSKEQFDAHLVEASRILASSIQSTSSTSSTTKTSWFSFLSSSSSANLLAAETLLPSEPSLKYLRDFMEQPQIPSSSTHDNTTTSTTTATATTPSPSSEPIDQITQRHYKRCCDYYRLILLQCTIQTLRTHWDTLTTIPDGDVDRAAVQHETLPPITTLPLHKINDVIRSHLSGTCTQRVQSLWALFDHDDDGLLDQVQMENVVWTGLKPVEHSVKLFFTEVVNAYPVRTPLPTLGEEEGERGEAVESNPVEKNGARTAAAAGGEKKKSRRQRRIENAASKKLIRTFHKTIKRHFDVEIETSKRLRCIYAWSNKRHQDDRIRSVLVDTGTTGAVGAIAMGRKRYVELHPKISFDEFREVQREHFAQLDRVGQDLVTSFKEELWIRQGRGRQNRRLRNETLVFLAVVGLVDAVICMM